MESAINKAASAEEKTKTARVKDLLGNEITSANTLLKELKDKDANQVEADAEGWGRKTHDLIGAAYGDGEAALFLDSSGYVFYGDGSDKSRIRNWIDGRMRRITELLRRADTLTVRKGFDPSKFD